MFARRAMVMLCSLVVGVAHAASDVPGVVLIQQSAVALRQAGGPCANFCGLINAAAVPEQAGCAALSKAACRTGYLWTLDSRTVKPCAWLSGTCGTTPEAWIHECPDPQTYCDAASVAPPETQRDVAILQESRAIVGDVSAVPSESARPAARAMEAVHHKGSIDLGADRQAAQDSALLDVPQACRDYFSNACGHPGPYPETTREIRGLFLACCKHGEFEVGKQMFGVFDEDSSDGIDKGELAKVLQAMDAATDWTQDAINLLMSALDYNNDGVIEMDEFLSFIQSEEGMRMLGGLIAAGAAELADKAAADNATTSQHSARACDAFAAESLQGDMTPVSEQQCRALKNFATIAKHMTVDGQDAKPSAGGDPHMINMKGERFDLTQVGVVELLRVPGSATAKDAYFTMKANVELVHGDAFMTSMELQGGWFGHKAISISLVSRRMVLKVGSVAQRPSSSVAVASEPHSITVSMPTERKVTIMIGDACIDIVEAGPPIDYYLNMAATSLTSLGLQVGGILGTDSLPPNARRMEAGAFMAQKKLDVIQPVLSYASAS